MPEHLSAEHQPLHHEQLTDNTEQRPSHAAEQPLQTAEATPSIESIRQKIEITAADRHEALNRLEVTETSKPSTNGFVSHSLKTMALQRTLKRVRGHLNPTDRVLSSIVHQSAVEKSSDLAASTIVRPYAMLSGGLCALLGSLTFVYLTRHYGYHYNFLLFAIFFLGGLIAGLLLEGLARLLTRLRK